jgi:hypothetical protein
LNVGTKDGVELGMKFDVLDPKGDSITDPETHEVLGSVLRPKVRVKVILVDERLSVAATYRVKKARTTGLGLGSTAFSGLFTQPLVDRVETLKTTEKTWEDLDESQSFVKTGDPVVQVLQTEDEQE